MSSLEACNSSQSNIKRQIMSSDDFDALAMPTSDLRHGHWTSSPFWKYRVTNYFSETDSCRNLFLLIDRSKHDDPQEKGRNKNEGIQDYSQAEPGFPSISCRYTSCLGTVQLNQLPARGGNIRRNVVVLPPNDNHLLHARY